MNSIRRIVLAFAVLTAARPGNARADAVADWNVAAFGAVEASNAGKTFLAQARVVAMTHAAIHDALNAIRRRYRPYAYDGLGPGSASPEAAVAAAAHAVLSAEVPPQKAALDAAFAAALSAIPDGPAKADGLAIGEAAAAAVLAKRANDGAATPLPYTPGTTPGAWQPTPAAFAPALAPEWAYVRPFSLTNPSEFRLPRPAYLDLASAAYAADYNEVRSLGEVGSTARTAEQTEIARYWAEVSTDTWNRLARNLAGQRAFGLWESARLFCLLNFALADATIAGFDGKYAYNFWRPVTAIRQGGADGNPDTAPDATWTPLLSTPRFPEFPSTHSVMSAAAAEVMADVFGTDAVAFTLASGAPNPGITRSYASFSQAAREVGDSRVYAGIHFRTACTEGLKMGERIGHEVLAQSLQPFANRWIVPASARTGGRNGAFYTTDLTIANTADVDLSFVLRFLGNGVDGRGGSERTFALAAGRSVTYADVLNSVFGLDFGFGAIEVLATRPELVAFAETSTPSGSGSVGQGTPATSEAELVRVGAARSLVGAREDERFRTNLVLANATEGPLVVDVALVGSSGTLLGTRPVALPPKGMVQASSVVRFLGVPGAIAGARIVVSTSTPGGAFAALLAVIDNDSQDPRTVLPR
jgi:hypothetical protein